MEKAGFKRVIVIGCGTIAKDVLRYVHECSGKYGYETEYVEYGEHPFPLARRYASEQKLPYYLIEKKDELLRFFIEKADVRLLIISAGNYYLFPKELVRNENVKIINFHNALLPDYPGRNAESWVIYESQKVTGITWHYVDEKIDDGSIIIQKSCAVEEDIKAYELSIRLQSLAAGAFCECFADVLTETAATAPQRRRNSTRIYKSYEIPGNAHFNLTDDAESIYRLLRALDCGKSEVFPPVKTEYQGVAVKITRYKVVTESMFHELDGYLYLSMGSGKYLMLRYKDAD